jgi:hypothetical protein
LSSITWDNADRLIQRMGDQTAELGYVAHERDTHRYVLWLKDVSGNVVGRGYYVRGEVFESRDDALLRAASSPSAFIMHLVWMFSLRRVSELEPIANMTVSLSEKEQRPVEGMILTPQALQQAGDSQE